MKEMKALVSLLLFVVICADCTTRVEPENAPESPGFPIHAPVPNADPSVREQVSVKVPTNLTAKRTADTLSITVDRRSLESTTITVGSKMVTGVRTDLFVYPVEESRPAEPARSGLSGGLDFNLGTAILNAKHGGIPVPDERYIVEMDLAIFETDIPPQHMWSPYSEHYKILWKGTLKQTGD